MTKSEIVRRARRNIQALDACIKKINDELANLEINKDKKEPNCPDCDPLVGYTCMVCDARWEMREAMTVIKLLLPSKS